MATLDKTTVRNEVNKLRADFEQLSAEGKVTVESRALMSSMLMIVELILTIFLEKNTKKNSKNSGIPPSQNKEEDLTSKSFRGKGKNNKALSDESLDNTRIKESVRIETVQWCNQCGEDLSKVPYTDIERRTKIDIVFEKVIEHVDAEIKQCPQCNAIVKGDYPTDMPGPMQYGNGLKAFAINLLISQMVPLARVQKLIESMMGNLLSEATLLNFIYRLHQSLEGWEQSAIEQLKKSSCMHVDETSFRVDKKNHWIHVYASDELTLKMLHRKRGKDAMEAIGIIPAYTGVMIHDCWASYLTYEDSRHGLCGAHLLRELTFIEQSNGYVWARNMKRLLQESCRVVSCSEEKRLSDKAYTNLQKRYRNIITRGEKELPPIPAKPTGRRGKLAKSDAHNLWERMKTYETSVLLFAKESHVAFTNNRAERDLRMAKVKQKVSGCFRTEKYAMAYCRISSYLQSMAYQGYNPLIAIQMALGTVKPWVRGE